MKKILAILLASAMMLALVAGCSNTTSNNSTAPSTNSTAPSTESTAPSEENTPSGGETNEVIWPVGTIDVLIPGKAGSNTDTSARIMLEYLARVYPDAKFNPINENTGNGTLASEMCRTAEPDGSTIYFTGSGNNIMYHQGKYEYSVLDPEQFTIITGAPGGNGQGSILLTQPDKPYNNCEEFVQYCHDHPGEVTFATNTGTTQEIKVKLFTMYYDLDVKFVILSGSDLVTALLAGNVDVGLQSENVAAQYIENGDLKGLVNNTHMEDGMSEATKDIDTYYDLGLTEIAFMAPMYVIGPAGMSDELCNAINAAFNGVVNDEESMERWAGMNSTYVAKSVEQIRAEVASTDADVAKVLAGEISGSEYNSRVD